MFYANLRLYSQFLYRSNKLLIMRKSNQLSHSVSKSTVPVSGTFYGTTAEVVPEVLSSPIKSESDRKLYK